MSLRQAKNPQSGRACAPGGSARQGAGDPPPDGRIVEFLFAVVCEAPCGLSGRLRERMRARRVGVRGKVWISTAVLMATAGFAGETAPVAGVALQPLAAFFRIWGVMRRQAQGGGGQPGVVGQRAEENCTYV